MKGVMTIGSRIKKLERMIFRDKKSQILSFEYDCGYDIYLKMEYRLKTKAFQTDYDFPAIFRHSFAAEI